MTRSLRSLVLEFVTANGPVSITEVVGAVGCSISSATAKRWIERERRSTRRRRYKDGSRSGVMVKDQASVGKRLAVCSSLGKLCREGKLIRVATGVYAKGGRP